MEKIKFLMENMGLSEYEAGFMALCVAGLAAIKDEQMRILVIHIYKHATVEVRDLLAEKKFPEWLVAELHAAHGNPRA